MLPPPPPSRPGKTEIAVCTALHAYTAQQPDELSFVEGAVIYVLNKDNKDWWKCRCDGSEGLVPSNYVGEKTTEIENPLHDAAKRGNIAFAKELIDAGISINGLDKAGNTPLHWAARGGHTEIVEMLLSRRPLVNAQNKLGDTALHLACWGTKTTETVSALLQYKSSSSGGSGAVDTSIRNAAGQTALELCRSDEVGALVAQFQSSNGGDGDDEGGVDSD